MSNEQEMLADVFAYCQLPTRLQPIVAENTANGEVNLPYLMETYGLCKDDAIDVLTALVVCLDYAKD